MSRPEKPIDWKKVDDLLIAGCLGTEIAAHFDMHADTFYIKVEKQYNMGFTAYSTEKRCKGDSLLRAKQFEKALEKDNTMLIWLGKQRLDQREPRDGDGKQNVNAEQLQLLADCLSRFQQRAKPSEDTKASENRSD